MKLRGKRVLADVVAETDGAVVVSVDPDDWWPLANHNQDVIVQVRAGVPAENVARILHALAFEVRHG